MLAADAFLDETARRGFTLLTGVPCSMLTDVIAAAGRDSRFHYVPAANEGDAVAIAAGAALGDRPAAVLMQNSGLGNAVNPLTSLALPFGIPLLLVVTLRGDPDAPPDEPQHALMGAITTRLLDLLGIPWQPLPADPRDLGAALDGCERHLRAARRPSALIVRAGTFRTAGAPSWPALPRPAPVTPPPAGPPAEATRRDVLAAVQSAADAPDLVLATTGHTGRELYALADRPNQFYMVGSMGCVSSLALGLAIAQPARRIVALDGDGAALMRLGALAAVGREAPANLVHILLDNGVHDSTGGQPTAGAATDFAAVGAACGYRRVHRVTAPAALAAILRGREPGPVFIHVPVRPGTAGPLPRPAETPAEAAGRLRGWLQATGREAG